MYQSSSSDSSDGGERFKNVHKLLIKSKENQRDLDLDYAHKQKLGDLIFDANFEGGNLCNVDQVNQYDYDLMVRPDVANPRHRIWFNFRVSNQRPSQCVIFTFVNLSENLSLVSEVGLTPVVRSRRFPNWTRLRLDQAFYYRSASHSQRRVLSIAFRFACHDDEHQFALHYPYTLSTLDHFLSRWSVQMKRFELTRLDRKELCADASRKRQTNGDSRKGTFPIPTGRRSCAKLSTAKKLAATSNEEDLAQLKVQILATTILCKPVYELTIGSKVATCDAQQRPWVIVLGRIGANYESASSFVCQGLLDFMLCEDQVAALARAHMNLLVFPMMDPDSIWAGNSRTDLLGQQPADDAKVVETNPELYKTYRLVRERIEMIRKSTRQRVVILEFRVNSNLIGSRVLGTLFADSLRMERHLHLPRLLSRFSDGFYFERCEFIESEQKWQQLMGPIELKNSDNCDSYRLEISPFGYHKRCLVKDSYLEYDQSGYLLLGKSVAYALLELTKTKSGRQSASVFEHLESFHPTARDVDDLVLNSAD